ncbi:tetratricopeptide repeat protein [Acidomonas methanolica]|uniref:O-linked N-acetylglucosamine transferase n=1 Tax=Acidomonas methanolica NBRC 104435 TaxID=1231351 RepID=A0A023D4N3_ACIMT|nr:tetratricopeptide repeat protein [Acidomonas methanolica]MBU2653553.1 tetratricopeptide repeat-containing glycosyltransferase family protein [Acidomonas methanolica]TCS31503.1 Flp pilus assembly protein TadD [Acidomonas methanolica]GAJ28715.1 O-linked N-acetylglucosamine transferase [Acidomonas methanolica NBRC 104435]GBQ53693.1 TPR repeat-containing protein [Acidomonas methanolica]GEK97923.1 hypothetical protein AME01nite_04220 [Acidomonas methanolica NBRC 104435]
MADSDAIAAGFSHIANANLAEAEACFTMALRERPGHAEAIHGLACVALARGLPGLAIGHAGQAIAVPVLTHEQTSRFHRTLGEALSGAGHDEAARAALAVAVMFRPGDPYAHARLGQSLVRLNRREEAEAAFTRAVDLAPADVGVRQALAVHYFENRSFSLALPHFRVICRLLPNDPAAWANLGATLIEVAAFSEARTVLEHAVNLGRPSVETVHNLGIALTALGFYQQAVAAFDEALTDAPQDARVLNSKGACLAEYGEYDAAERLLHQVVEMENPVETARALFTLGTIDLGRGTMARGWKRFEERHALPGARPADGGTWDGQPTNQVVTVHAEQGLGDTIQFLRFIPMAAERAPLMLDLPEQVVPLLERMPAMRDVPDGRVRVGRGTGARAGLLSLPVLLGLNGPPADAPYLDVPFSPSARRRRVGLSWAGNPTYRFDARRSLDFDQLAPILAVPGIEFVCLQKDASPESRGGMICPPLDDLGDLADAIAGCDLVIGVDSLVIHLAGAMGHPAWLLNRLGGDWRWRGPRWYRSVRIFNVDTLEPPPTCWNGLIRRIGQELAAFSGGGNRE